MNQFTPRHNVNTMARLSNEDIADMYMAYGATNGAARLYQERFPNPHFPGHCMFANIDRRL